MGQYANKGNTTSGNQNNSSKNEKTSKKRSKYSQTDVNKMADRLIGEVQKWIKDGTKKYPRYESATVSKVYEDGTVDIYLPGSQDEKFTRIQNQSVFELKEGDDVEVLLKNGSFNNCWIVACHNPYSAARLNAVQYRNVGGSASGGGGSSSGGGGNPGGEGGTGVNITRLSQLQNDVGFITGTAPTINNANLIGVPTAPTAAAGTNTEQIATTAFVATAIINAGGEWGGGTGPGTGGNYDDEIAAINTEIDEIQGNIATLSNNLISVGNQLTSIGTQLTTINQRLTALENGEGGSTGPGEGGGDGTDYSQQISDLQTRMTTAESNINALLIAMASKANVMSPIFSGTPMAPTAEAGTNTQQIATTEFVQTAIANL